MKLSTLFLPKELQRAEKELDCYGYCLDNAIAYYLNGEFEKASIYHENAARSLRELQSMKNNRKAVDQARELLQQIDDQEVAGRYLC